MGRFGSFAHHGFQALMHRLRPAEVVLELDFAIRFFEFEATVLDVQTMGGHFGSAQADNIGAKFVEARPFDGWIQLESDQCLGRGGIMEGDPVGQPGAQRIGEGVVAKGFFIVQLFNELEGVLAGLPIAEAALAPIGKILLIDWASPELGLEDGFYFWLRVKPFEDGLCRFAILEADIDLVPDLSGKPGDFTFACVFHEWMTGLMD